MTQDEDWTGPVADTPDTRPILDSQSRFDGRIWSIRSDTVDFDGHHVVRDVLLHLGAVAVIALDDADRVLLIRQYRHPVAMSLFEPPAGLLDVPGEPPWQTAARELAEEAGYRAQTWHTLVDMLNSPGGSSEAIRVYLARGLEPLPGGREHTGEAEEGHLPRAWLPLEEAVALVLAGSIQSPSAVCGILAAHVARERGWVTLRPADAAWESRSVIERAGRVQAVSRD